MGLLLHIPCWDDFSRLLVLLYVGVPCLHQERSRLLGIPGQAIASSNEVTLNSGYCWEYTNIGFNSGLEMIVICTVFSVRSGPFWKQHWGRRSTSSGIAFTSRGPAQDNEGLVAKGDPVLPSLDQALWKQMRNAQIWEFPKIRGPKVPQIVGLYL